MRHRRNALLIVHFNFLLLQTLSVAAVYIGGRDGPQVANTNYDFIIVGGMFQSIQPDSDLSANAKLGGTAGNVVANRLTENPAFSVLLLEAGSSYALPDFVYCVCSALLIFC
jgi:hypothetical protein